MSDHRHDPPGDDPDERSRPPADEYERRKARMRQRYSEDPEYRQKIIAGVRAYRKAHQKEINAQNRARYAEDEELRRKVIAASTAWNAAHRDRCNARHHTPRGRDRYLRSQYGISLADYQAMWIKQKGVCAICETNPDGKLFVDHDHDRKHVRELLCRCCNLGLGFFKDRPSLLEKAAAYARKHGRED